MEVDTTAVRRYELHLWRAPALTVIVVRSLLTGRHHVDVIAVAGKHYDQLAIGHGRHPVLMTAARLAARTAFETVNRRTIRAREQE
jgi:hypothetical protein